MADLVLGTHVADGGTAPSGALLAAIETRRGQAMTLLETLVNMPSGSYGAADVDAVGDRVVAAWEELGFSDAPLPVEGRGRLRRLSRSFPHGQGGRVLILGHLDTVWAAEDSAGWTYADDGAIATGPGVGDMKGGLSMAWLSVAAMLDSGSACPSEIAVLLVPDEEIGSPGSRAIIETEALASRAVLVLEPSRPGGEIVVGRGAVGAMVLRARGRTAHVAVNPTEGISALVPLAGLVGPISALAGPGGAQASIGILRSGAARQVVPELAEMHVDLRAPTQEGALSLESDIRKLVADVAAAAPGVSISIEGGVTRPAFPVAVGEALCNLYLANAAAWGKDIGRVTTRGGSDGSFGAALGVPTLDGLGPICFDTCSRRERIILASMDERAALYAQLMITLAEHPDLALA
ncbi:M20/M25/M40 family metallo-hydrolase [Frigidibacter sp. MR17.24]|uniref:M20/M25/M40 family metallo-hydrolase n=1 Tax=Frigidibacter sp. MR17.24 TaxID=3127345 RepID=UPI003012A9E8